MNKKNVLLFLSMFFFFQEGIAQNIFFDLRSTVKRSDIYYSRLSYSKALELYSQALLKKKNKSKISLNKKAAGLYRKMGRYQEAKQCYENLIASGYVFTSQDSIDYFNIHQSVDGDSLTSEIYSWKKWNDLFRDTLYYSLSALPFNTDHSEYCPVAFKKGLLYVSDQEPSSLVRKYNGLNEGGFATLQYTALQDTTWMPAERIGVNIKALHAGPLSIYNGQKNAIINICIEDKKKPYRLSLYQSEYDSINHQWKIGSALPFNNHAYSVGHPAVTEDGKTLFFISDQEGGSGGTDLYVTNLIHGTWTTPVNMGNKINTMGNEQYPHINNNILFFSSDGRYGLGGFDIYGVDLDFKDSAVFNVGFPVNSNRDDFGFYYDAKNQTGYFSSDRKNKKKGDNLYSFKENKILLKVILKDDLDKKNIENVEIEIRDYEWNIPIRYFSGEEPGLIQAWLKPGHQYKMIIKKEDYRNDTLYISTVTSEKITTLLKEIYLKRKSIYYASVRLYNEEQKEITDTSFIVVNNITIHKKDTIRYLGTWYQVKLDSECEYIITSRNKDSLRYIFVDTKPKNIVTKPYYNMYLSSPKSAVFHVILKKSTDEVLEDPLKIKIMDWVNGNEFFVSPGPDGDFQFVVTDSRLFDFYLNANKILYSTREIKVQGYLITFFTF